ncbi:hypothetical protein WDH52_03835 [Streptomyces sp. TRM70308]|uniref:hypothetical protein n=1 Tax=Streptomyces sp. TRM70308 TaxID=3131932 RepID=UPI003D029F37
MEGQIGPAPVDGAEAREVLRASCADIVGRYHGPAATAAEVAAAMADEPSDALAPPHGRFLLAR